MSDDETETFNSWTWRNFASEFCRHSAEINWSENYRVKEQHKSNGKSEIITIEDRSHISKTLSMCMPHRSFVDSWCNCYVHGRFANKSTRTFTNSYSFWSTRTYVPTRTYANSYVCVPTRTFINSYSFWSTRTLTNSYAYNYSSWNKDGCVCTYVRRRAHMCAVILGHDK